MTDSFTANDDAQPLTETLKEELETEVSNRNYLNSILQSMMDALIVLHPGTMIRTVNPALLKMLHYTEAELVGQPIDKIVMGKIASLKKLAGLSEKTLITKEGQQIPVALTATWLHDQAGKPDGMVCVVHNSPEPQLRLITTALDQSSDIVMITDRDNRIVYVNKQFSETYGFLPDEVIGQTPQILSSEETPSELLMDMLATLSSGKVWRGQVQSKRKDGSTFWGTKTISPIHDPSGNITHFLGLETDNSRHTKSEDQLRKLSSAVEQSASMIMITNSEGTIEYVNSKFSDVTGYSHEEALGQKSSLLKSDETAEAIYERLWDTLRDGNEWRGEMPHRKKNGDLFWVRMSLSTIRDNEGAVTHFLSVEEDITLQRESEDALLASEERYRNLFDRLPIGLFRTTPEGKFLDANLALAQMLGYSEREDMFSIGIADLYENPSDREESLKLINQQGSVTDHYVKLHTKTGQPIWVQEHARAVYDETGNPVYYEGSVQDITLRAEVELALMKSEHKYRELVDQASDGILVSGEEGRLLEVNGSGCELFGYNRDELLALQITDLIPISALSEEAIHFIELPPGQIIRFEHQYHRKDETLLDLEINAKGLPDGRVQSIVRDITARKNIEAAERKQRILAEALRDSAKAISSTLAIGEVLDYILENVQKVVTHDGANVVLYQDDSARIVRSSGYFSEQADEQLETPEFNFLERKIFSVMAETGNPLVISSTAQFEGWVPLAGEAEWVCSYLGAPIIYHQEIIGFLNLVSAANNAFSDNDAEHLKSFADQAALAIRNAQIFETERKERVVATTLRKTAETLAQSIRLGETLESVLNQLEQIVRYDQASISLLQNDQFQVVAARGFPNLEELLQHKSTYGEVALEQTVLISDHPVIVQDTLTDLRWDARVAYGSEVRSWVGLPLVASDMCLGMLTIARRTPGVFREDDLEIIRAFTQQAAVAVRNANIIEHLDDSLMNLHQAQEHLRRNARLSAAGEIAAGVAHQINNPLAAIMGRIYLLERELTQDHPAMISIVAIKRAAYRAGSVVQRMLDLARDREYVFEELNLNESVRSAISLIHAQFESDQIHLETELAPNLPSIEGSDQHLQDAWLNILLNAKDAVSGLNTRGTIRVTSSWIEASKEVEILIEDNGPGISKEAANSIFTPFFTTKEHGTGLGLAIVHEVITRHNGSIAVDSEEGKGTRFTILLPLRQGQNKSVLQPDTTSIPYP